jgi:hypothetical protein
MFNWIWMIELYCPREAFFFAVAILQALCRAQKLTDFTVTPVDLYKA